MRETGLRWIVAATVTACLAGGCAGGGPGAGDVPGIDAPDAGDDAVVQDAAGDAVTRPPTVVDKGFRLLLQRVESLNRSGPWLVLLDPTVREWDADAAPAPVIVAGPQTTDFPESRNPDIDCAAGCYTDPALRWLAHFDAEAVQDGRPFLRVGPLDPETLAFSHDGSVTIPDVTDLAFAGDRLYVSQRLQDCEAQAGTPKTCWAFLRMDLDSSPGVLESLFTFPTFERLGFSAHAGNFTVSANGETVVVQDPGNGTLGVWAWREAWKNEKDPLRRIIDPICGTLLDGSSRCQSEPGRFGDREPLAVSADGTLVALAVVENDEALRWVLADLGPDRQEGEPPTWSTVAYVSVSAQNALGFRADAYLNTKTVPFTRIHASPRFAGTGDDAELLFVGEFAPPNTYAKEKTTTNLAAIPVGTLRAGTELRTLAPFRRITRFAVGDVPENVLIPEGGFDPSPDGTFVAFVGTPVLDSNGEPLTPKMAQHRNDLEVHVTRRDGTTEPVQVSGQGGTRTWGLATVAWPLAD
ncbi:MAG TPA: hypothetical protein PK313_00360 [Myxococcota bacterium]|jgi:hypothetical protein|nr:hypothetical protein [Myxococcota bacterium]